MGEEKQGFLKGQLGILQIPIVTVVAIWAAYLLQLLTADALLGFGLQPRTASGAWGIVAMPFLHAGWGHLLSNTIPLLVLTTLLAVTGKGWGTMGGIVLLNGVLLWLFGRGGRIHVGASGLVYGLALFLICRGLVDRKAVLIVVSIVVLALYGTVLLSGVIPTAGGVSWDGHLFGGVAGAVMAFRLRKKPDERGASA
jgi:membrane associated rhomboid family serine protease